MNRAFAFVDSSSAMLFDGSTVDAWQIVMSSSVLSARTKLISPGRLYTFIIQQNATGGHPFVWPGNCVNGTAVDLRPNAITVQNFIGRPGGVLYANIPGTYL